MTDVATVPKAFKIKSNQRKDQMFTFESRASRNISLDYTVIRFRAEKIDHCLPSSGGDSLGNALSKVSFSVSLQQSNNASSVYSK